MNKYENNFTASTTINGTERTHFRLTLLRVSRSAKLAPPRFFYSSAALPIEEFKNKNGNASSELVLKIQFFVFWFRSIFAHCH